MSVKSNSSKIKLLPMDLSLKEHKFRTCPVPYPKPVILKEVTLSGGACPYQIEGYVDNGDYFYLRYRAGRLRCGCSQTELEFWKVIKWNVIDKNIGDVNDGYSFRQMLFEFNGNIVFPIDFDFLGIRPRLTLVLNKEIKI